MTSNEANTVALLMEHRTGHVHVFADGSALWSALPADPARYVFADDCPVSVPCQPRTYGAARVAFRQAMKTLRARGIR